MRRMPKQSTIRWAESLEKILIALKNGDIEIGKNLFVDGDIEVNELKNYTFNGTNLEEYLKNYIKAITGKNIVFGRDANGEQTTFKINVDSEAYSIGYRNANGQMNVSEPTEDNNAVNLKYFNEHSSKSNSKTFTWFTGESGEKTFAMGTSKRILVKLFISGGLWGTIYVQHPAYYYIDFTDGYGKTLYMNNYIEVDFKTAYPTLNGPHQTIDHRTTTEGGWGWIGLGKASPSDESRQVKYIYNQNNNNITFNIVDHTDYTYILEVETLD